MGYKRCLTVAGSQGQESNIVIFIFTKPRTNFMAEVGLISSEQQLDVALTRDKKLLIVVMNMRIWNAEFVRAAKKGSSRYPAGCLKNTVDKRDVLRWLDRETVERAFDSIQPQRMPAAPGSTTQTQKKEQRTDTIITQSARAVDDEVAKANLQIKRIELNDSIEGRTKSSRCRDGRDEVDGSPAGQPQYSTERSGCTTAGSSCEVEGERRWKPG